MSHQDPDSLIPGRPPRKTSKKAVGGKKGRKNSQLPFYGIYLQEVFRPRIEATLREGAGNSKEELHKKFQKDHNVKLTFGKFLRLIKDVGITFTRATVVAGLPTVVSAPPAPGSAKAAEVENVSWDVPKPRDLAPLDGSPDVEIGRIQLPNL
jgi:hypothetical protein